MKQQTAQQRTTQTPTRRRTAATDTHERQAREAAARILSGEQDVNRLLTGAPAARTVALPYRSGPGAPLPLALRVELETAFGAELGAVRLHTGAPAEQAAALEHARAFTSGRNIYFAEGEFRPNTGEGRELVVHEVAHVLQQTGRRDAEGLVHATASHGSADVQRDPTLNDLARRYRDSTSSEPDDMRTALNEMIGELETLLGGTGLLSTTTGEGATIVAFEARVKRGEFNARLPIARSFLLDALKLLGRFEGAAYLLTEDRELRTSLFLQAFVDFIDTDPNFGLDWSVRLFRAISDIDRRYPYNYVDAIWRYLTRPMTPPSNSYQYGQMVDTYIRNYNASTDFWKDNERIVSAYLALRFLNNDLRDSLRHIEDSYQMVPIATRRFYAAQDVKRSAENEMREHQAQTFRDLSPEVLRIAEAALAYWRQARQLGADTIAAARILYHDPDATVTLPRPPAAVSRDPAFQEFVRVIKDGITALLSPADETNPLLGPQAYADAVAALNTALTARRQALSDQLETLYTQRDIGDEEKRNVAAWYGWAQLFLDDMQVDLGNYKRDVDDRLVAQHNAADARLSHRYEMAKRGYVLARVAEDAPFIATTTATLRGEDLARSYLAFTGDWEEETEISLWQIADDYPGRRIRSYGLSARQIARIFYLLRLRAVNAALRAQLAAAETDLSPDTLGMIARAIEEGRANSPMPSRWRPLEHTLVWYEGDADSVVLGALLEEHPRWQELLNIDTHRQDDLILADDRRVQVYVWFLPSFNRLTTYLYGIQGLRQVLERAFGRAPSAAELLWFLDELADVGASADASEELRALFNDAADEINGESRGDVRVAERQQDRLLRRASTHDRRVLARQFTTRFDAFADDHGGVNFGIPNRVLEQIDDYARDVRPRADRAVQRAALLLEIAPAMHRAFIQDKLLGDVIIRRHDVITEYFGYLRQTLEFADAVDARDRLNPILHASEDAARLLEYREHLRTILSTWRQVIRERQLEYGFRTSTTGARRLRSPSEIGLDDEFTIDRNTYLITAIHNPFTYHPAYGKHTSAETPSILTDLNDADIPRDGSMPLLTYIVNDSSPIEITSDPRWDEDLDRLTHAINMELIIRQLEDLRQGIEAVSRGFVDVASLFVVPAGPAVVAAADLIFFLMNELPNLRENVFDLPQQIAEGLEQFLSIDNRAAMLEQLWVYALFEGRLPFQAAIEARLDRTPTRPRSNRRLGRLIQFVRRLGARILEAFLALRRRIRAGMVRAQAVVLRNRRLRRLLGALPMIIELADVVEPGFIYDAAEVLGDVIDDPSSVTDALRKSLDEVFEGLNGMEVPEELLPMGPVYSIIIDLFVGSLGVKGKIIRQLMRIARVTDYFGDKIAEALREQGIDPNALWKDYVRDAMQSMLHDAQVELTRSMNMMLRRYFGPTFTVSEAGLTAPEVVLDTSQPALDALPDEEEARGPRRYFRHHHHLVRPPQPIDLRRGAPLSPATRARYEAAFGHNFEHVRIHSGAHAERFTAHFGARALTSGSHIILSEGVPPNSARADAVLRHELAHVLQQTGSRPLSLDADPTPTPGQPGRGLRRDPRREAAAEKMARATQTRGADPVPVDEEGGAGWLPSLASVVNRVAEELVDEDITIAFVSEIDTIRRVPREISQKTGFVAAVREAQQLWTEARRQLGATAEPTNPLHRNSEPFDTADAREAVRTFFTSFNLDSTKIRALTSRSIRERANESVVLNKGGFIRNLQAYIYGRSGVDTRIDATGPSVGFVKVRFTHLGLVSRNSRLWTKMEENTRQRMQSGHPGNPATFDARQWARVRVIINSESHDAPVWHRTEYRLSDDFITEMRVKVMDFGTAQISNWDEYRDTATITSRFAGTRVGTHGQLTGAPTRNATLEPRTGPHSGEMASEARAGRESHHIPQYLLVEYFRNQNQTRHLKKRVGARQQAPPGFAGSASAINTFSDDAGHTVNLQRLDPTSGRGAGLPAISLAARAHQRGRLHINTAFNWHSETDEFSGSPTQAVRMDRKFYQFLNRRMNHTGNAAEAIATAHGNPTLYKPRVYEAIRDSYHWMYNMMIAALPHALRTIELPFYEAVAVGDASRMSGGELKREYRPREADVATIVSAISRKNSEVMQNWM